MKNILLIFLIFYSLQLQGQSATASFFKLSTPEKWWVIFHPFKSKKALKITNKTLIITDSLKAKKTIGMDTNGGQLDAFKHSFWIANLSQNIGKRAALKLGVAHEKGNYKMFKKHRLEDGVLPDKASSDMDLFNNQIGAEIGMDYINLNVNELTQKVIMAVQCGEMKILKKDAYGAFLDCQGKPISVQDLKGQWENKKCLVASNQIPDN